MITNEQILNDQGPSLKLPWSPNPFETAGRTNTIVEVPVIANTVHIKTISRYHAADQRSGIGFGAKNDFQKSEDDDDDDDDDDGCVFPVPTASFTDLLSPLVFNFPPDAKRRLVAVLTDLILHSVFAVPG